MKKLMDFQKLTVGDLAYLFKVPRSTIQYWAAVGKLPPSNQPDDGRPRWRTWTYEQIKPFLNRVRGE